MFLNQNGFGRLRFLRLSTLCFCFYFGVLVTAGHADGDPRCSTAARAGVTAEVNRALALRQDSFGASLPNPPSVAQTINTPCKSRELQRIANKFAYAPSGYASQILGNANTLAGPAAGIMNQIFKADFQKFMNLANFSSVGQAFQGFANEQLGGLLTSLGLGDSPFDSALCGMMVDTLLKYIQCEAPIRLPSLGSIQGSLNDLLPDGCAGDAVRNSLYAAARAQSVVSSGQSISVPSGGLYTPGIRPTFGGGQ